MRFKPVHFGKSYPTIGKADVGNSFQLSPAASSIPLSQNTANLNARADSDRFDFTYLSDNLKMH